MNRIKTILTLILVVFLSKTTAQTVAGYSFEKYSTQKPKALTKAKINFNSNPTARQFKTVITNTYNTGQVDFSGYYITVFWGCGTGCVSGVMVDTRDGKIYNLPIDEQTYRNFCRSDNDKSNEETILFKPNSRLFITTSCDEYDIENTSKSKQVKEYFINVWNEPKKKFETNKSIKKTVIKKTN